MFTQKTIIVVVIIFLMASIAIADVPQTISYQGRLTNPGGTPVTDGVYSVVFNIYDASVAGTSVWTETQNISTTSGLFSVLLGSVNPILDTVFNQSTRYLGIEVAGDPELSPRTALVSVPYAQRVSTIDGSNGGQLTGSVVWDNAMALVDDPMMYLFDPAPAGPSTRRIYAHSPTIPDLGLRYNTSNESFEFSFGGPVMTIEMLTHKVGIGTNAPQAELDIVGVIRAQGVSMGVNPTRSGFQSTIGGGGLNTVSADWATVAGGQQNVASGIYSTTSGGQNNNATGGWSSIGGGGDNTAGDSYATVGGGTNNTVSGTYSTIAGGIQHSVSGQYSSILGGFADTISSNYSYLFGIKTSLAQDSTFRVDLPHIQFGSAASGYEFPPIDGTTGQVLSTDGSGQVDWVDPSGGGGANGWVDDGTIVRLDDNNDSVGIGTSTPLAPVHIIKNSNSSTPAFGFRTDFSNTGTGGGIAAYIAYNHGSSSGLSSGMLISSTANSSDTAYGIGVSANNDGAGPAKGGLFTAAGSGAGHKYGIEALAENQSSSETRGVYGIASNSSSGPATGGYFETRTGGTGPKTGVAASAEDNSAALSTGISALAYNTGSGSALAASLQASGGSGINRGVDLLVSSSGLNDAYGYIGNVVVGNGTGYGAKLEVTTTTGTKAAYGILSRILNSGSGTSYSGYFNIADLGTGIKTAVSGIAEGTHSATVTGVNGYARNNGTGVSIGVSGRGTSHGTGTHYGVYGQETAGGLGAAVYAAGDQVASGTKSAVIRTSQGEKLMYTVEATEVWFEHIGRAQLINGHVHVELDPIFLETIEISSNNPMQVFVQLNDDCNGTYVKTTQTGFDVYELQSGTSNAIFTYKAMAKRKGYITEYMRDTEVGKYDVNLYPERKAEIEAYWDKQADQTSSEVSSIN